jgi:hypothetical protein
MGPPVSGCPYIDAADECRLAEGFEWNREGLDRRHQDQAEDQDQELLIK